MGLYKITRPDGSVEYTDLPSGPGRVDGMGERAPRTPDEQHKDHALAKSLIKEAQKRIPKVKDYLEYLEYLRHNSPVRFDFVMEQFRPLLEQAFGTRVGRYQFGTGVGLASVSIICSA